MRDNLLAMSISFPPMEGQGFESSQGVGAWAFQKKSVEKCLCKLKLVISKLVPCVVQLMEFDESKHSDSQDNDDEDAKLSKKDEWVTRTKEGNQFAFWLQNIVRIYMYPILFYLETNIVNCWKCGYKDLMIKFCIILL